MSSDFATLGVVVHVKIHKRIGQYFDAVDNGSLRR